MMLTKTQLKALKDLNGQLTAVLKNEEYVKAQDESWLNSTILEPIQSIVNK